jgi:anti-sigma regulatory factor (Ser/Thr protein kinase)
VLDAGHGLDDDVALLVAHAVPVDRRRLDLTLDAAPTTLAPLRRALARWLDANAVGQQTAYDILLAVNESATDAIEHAYGPGAARFSVAARRDGDAVEIVIRDSRRWRPARGEHRGRDCASCGRRWTRSTYAETRQDLRSPCAGTSPVRPLGAHRDLANIDIAHGGEGIVLARIVGDLDLSNLHAVHAAVLDSMPNEAVRARRRPVGGDIPRQLRGRDALPPAALTRRAPACPRRSRSCTPSPTTTPSRPADRPEMTPGPRIAAPVGPVI